MIHRQSAKVVGQRITIVRPIAEDAVEIATSTCGHG